MLKIDFSHLISPIDEEVLSSNLAQLQKMSGADFLSHQPDMAYIKESAAALGAYKNIVIIANGGSRTSAWAFYNAFFLERNDVHFEFLSSAEPELLADIKRRLPAKDTLLLAISKSGTNINMLEPLLALQGYKAAVITEDEDNILSQIANIKGFPKFIHPQVGGRFSGLTSCALIPAALMGLDVDQIRSGAEEAYAKFAPSVPLEKNAALKFAAALLSLEKKGYTELFASIYSTRLYAFLPLIIQLLHESVGKEGAGQTIYGDYSPESQHHTNQRFFGGRRNVAGILMRVEKSSSDFPIHIENEIAQLELAKTKLSALDGESALSTMHHDLEGVLGHAVEKKIPALTLSLEEFGPKSAGYFMAFWQMVALYSAVLAGVDPFNQPEVERSKQLSWTLRTGK